MPDLPVVNTSDPGYTRDPYAALAPLRARGPVVRVVLDGLPVWLVLGHEEAVRVLSSPKISNDGVRNAGPDAREVFWTGAVQRGMQSHLGRLDPPDHDRLRRLVQQAFTPRRVAALEPWIRQIARGLLAAFPARGEIDLIDAFAAPLPITVIGELLGIEPGERAEFRYWTDRYLHSDETQAEVMAEAGRAVAAQIAGLLDRRRAALGDAPLDVAHEGTLTDGLIRARDRDDRLSERELLSVCHLLLGAGYDTTLHLIANGARLLLTEPERLRALRAAPETLPAAIEEFLRLDPPVKVVFVRYALADLEIGGVTIRTGEPMLVHHSAVSRDPRRHPDPDAYDPGRPASSHLAFGHGLHYCLGAPLARLEARVAFEELLAACPGLELATPADTHRWVPSRLFRGLAELPVRITRTDMSSGS